MVAGDSLAHPSSKLTANLCALLLVRRRRGRSPGDCLLLQKVLKSDKVVDLNKDQEAANIQSGCWSDQNVSETGLRDTGTPSTDILWNINTSCADFIEQSKKLIWEVQ